MQRLWKGLKMGLNKKTTYSCTVCGAVQSNYEDTERELCQKCREDQLNGRVIPIKQLQVRKQKSLIKEKKRVNLNWYTETEDPEQIEILNWMNRKAIHKPDKETCLCTTCLNNLPKPFLCVPL